MNRAEELARLMQHLTSLPENLRKHFCKKGYCSKWVREQLSDLTKPIVSVWRKFFPTHWELTNESNFTCFPILLRRGNQELSTLLDSDHGRKTKRLHAFVDATQTLMNAVETLEKDVIDGVFQNIINRSVLAPFVDENGVYLLEINGSKLRPDPIGFDMTPTDFLLVDFGAEFVKRNKEELLIKISHGEYADEWNQKRVKSVLSCYERLSSAFEFQPLPNGRREDQATNSHKETSEYWRDDATNSIDQAKGRLKKTQQQMLDRAERLRSCQEAFDEIGARELHEAELSLEDFRDKMLNVLPPVESEAIVQRYTAFIEKTRKLLKMRAQEGHEYEELLLSWWVERDQEKRKQARIEESIESIRRYMESHPPRRSDYRPERGWW